MDHSAFLSIKAFVFDVDGVLTDGTVLISESGELLRRFNVNDGQAIKYALEAGYIVAIITKGKSKGVRNSLTALGVSAMYDNLKEKESALADLKQKFNLSKDQILYMGDDIPDLDISEDVGIFSCPNDSCPEVLKRAQYVSPYEGGKTCAREVIRRVLKIHGKWIS